MLEVKCIDGDIWKYRVFPSPGSTAEAESVTCRVSLIPNGTAGTHGIALQFLLEFPSHPPGNAQTIFQYFSASPWQFQAARRSSGESPQVLQGACQGLHHLWVD